MQRKQALKATPVSSGPGRPARSPGMERIAVYIPGELKRWLRHRAIDTGQDMGQLVAAAVFPLRT